MSNRTRAGMTETFKNSVKVYDVVLYFLLEV